MTGEAIDHGRALLLEIGGFNAECWAQSDKTYELAPQLADALAMLVGYPKWNEEKNDYCYDD